jgi:23S rRNA (adenine2503-C2)-methyltransferase
VQHTRLIIIGAGPAGCAAAVQCARLGIRPLVIDRAGVAGGLLGNAFRIENYPGLPPLPGIEFAQRLERHLRRFGLGVTPVRALGISPAADEILCVETDAGPIAAGAVLLATGTRPQRLELPGAPELEGRGLFYEVRDLLGVLSAPRQVVIIGGGEAALDYALALAARGTQVTVLLRGSRPQARGRLLAMARRNERVILIDHTRTLALHEDMYGVHVAFTGDGKPREAIGQAVLAAIGRRSTAPELLGPGVMVGRPGLFVIGDARRGKLGQAGIAVGDGLEAAMAAVEYLTTRRHRPRTATAAGARGSCPPLRIVAEHGDDDLARVYVAATADGSQIEFVESVQPPVPREQKWVLIVSTLKGCPIGCPMCDAGGSYRGRLSAEEILAQIDHLIRRRYPDGRVPVPKLKVQFARMGDPALNDAVLDTLRTLPTRWEVPGMMPSISTIAPAGRECFFEELLQLKQDLYAGGRFQMQFSLHTTDEKARRTLIPARTWAARAMADYGRRFHNDGDRKITLNFAAVRGLPLEPAALLEHFDPRVFLVKLTPINPTYAARRAQLRGIIDETAPGEAEVVANRFRAAGYETLVSIGQVRENEIGSNCGMYVAAARSQVPSA